MDSFVLHMELFFFSYYLNHNFLKNSINNNTNKALIINTPILTQLNSLLIIILGILENGNTDIIFDKNPWVIPENKLINSENIP